MLTGLGVVCLGLGVVSWCGRTSVTVTMVLLLPDRVVVLDKVTDLLLFFGKLLVVGGVGEYTHTHEHAHAGLMYSSGSC